MPLQDPLLACLEELGRRYHRPRSVQALTAGLPLGEGGLTPELFARAAERNGFQVTPHNPARPLIDASFPLLAFDANGNASLILRDEIGALERWQASDGTTHPTDLADLRANPPVHSLLITVRVQLDERAGLFGWISEENSWFWSTLWRYHKVYLDTALAALLVNCFALASPMFVMNVYDRVVPNRAFETLWVLASGVIIVFLFEFVLRTLRAYFIDAAGKRADNRMSALLFERVMGLRLEQRPASAGSLANSFKEFETLRDFFTSATLTTLIDLPFVFVFLFAVWLVGGPLFWIPLLAIPLLIGIGLAFQPALSRAMQLNQAESSQKHGLLIEAVGGIETIKTLSAEGAVQAQWEHLVQASSESGRQSRILSTIAVNLGNGIQQFVYVAVVAAGVYLIADNQITTGALVAGSMMASRAMAPLGQVMSLFLRYQSARHGLAGLNRLVAFVQERPKERRFLERSDFKGDIQMKDIAFAYPGQKFAALEGIDITIKAGEHVAFIGRVGSGKTTLLKLILGLYQAQKGSLTIDGIDIAQIDPADLRACMGYVEQDARLFFGTLRDNIALGRPHASDAEILEAAELSGLEDYVKRHPAGYEMRIGENGIGLSGGQRQAVALARMFLRKPQIVLLDEPSADMDSLSEQRLIQALKRYSEGRTLLLITHKPALLALVDKLAVVDGGKIVAFGPTDQILHALARPEKT